jgi:hypothetical protein
MAPTGWARHGKARLIINRAAVNAAHICKEQHVQTQSELPGMTAMKSVVIPEFAKLMTRISRGEKIILAYGMTPEVAAKILEHCNVGNRRIRERHLRILASEMAGGRWMLTGSPIIFSGDGRLLDGQHRLQACVKSGKGFITDLRIGIDHDTFPVIDRGKNRDATDVLGMAGFTNAARLARGIRWAVTIDAATGMNTGSNLQPEDVLELARTTYREMPKFLGAAQAIQKMTHHPDGMLSGLLYQANELHHGRAFEFSEAWRNNQWSGRYAAIGVMEKTMGIMRRQNRMPTPMHHLYMLVTCWNCFISNRSGYQSTYMNYPGGLPELR